jgi:hypothetical protein
METKVSVIVAALLFTFVLSGCAYLRSGGPCYGFGCHESAPSQTAQSTTRPPRKDVSNKNALAKSRATSENDAQEGN